ncbi:hypothetical protein ACTQ45_11735 [Fundicoccus sp. Sow4_D5]|uniref:hypothetical protein n=1 Tax=Fundicoccus sp. Sow4_D5 TaxID=3438782 RepID=UPI003F932628
MVFDELPLSSFKDSPLFEGISLASKGNENLKGTKKQAEGKQIKKRLTTVIELIPHTKVSSAI